MADHKIDSSRKETCGGCTLKCLGAHPSSTPLGLSSPLSFYKVMAGDFSFELEFPLEIATRMKSRASTDVILTGPSGHLWHVSFCRTDTSVSFGDGWKSFVYDNGIVAGDILVFRHVVNMHFIVQVFEASHCEKECTLQSYKPSCCRGGILSELCRQKSCKHRKIATKVSTAEHKKYKDTEYKNLSGDKEQTSLDCNKTTTLSSETTLSYEAIRKMLCNTEKSISQNQGPLFQKRPSCLVTDLEVASCSVTNDDSESIPVFSSSPMFSVTIQKSAAVCNFWFTIPTEFANRWLPKKNTEVILLHHKNPGIWRVRYKTIRHGWAWKHFIVRNNIHQGDKCAFELINTVNCTFKVYVIR